MANIFPRWTHWLPLKVAVGLGCVLAGIGLAFTVYATPKAAAVGYQPSQPIPFSHKVHVDQIGMDCRYCHAFVDVAGPSTLPSGSTCWNCHQHVLPDSPKLVPLRKSVDPTYPGYDGKPLEWVRVHKLPDFVYFDHSAHVNRGVSCLNCHGSVDQMEVVFQAQPLSMSWCLDCHRAPENALRPLEEVYNLKYDAATYLAQHPELGNPTPAEFGRKLKQIHQVNSKDSCTTCHR